MNVCHMTLAVFLKPFLHRLYVLFRLLFLLDVFCFYFCVLGDINGFCWLYVRGAEVQ